MFGAWERCQNNQRDHAFGDLAPSHPKLTRSRTFWQVACNVPVLKTGFVISRRLQRYHALLLYGSEYLRPYRMQQEGSPMAM